MTRATRVSVAALAAACLTVPAASAEEVLTVMSYGGNYQKTQQVYFDESSSS